MKSLANKEQAKNLARFFKTGKGDYGYGDRFLGITVPRTRMVARAALDLPVAEIQKLLRSPFHEIRLLALIIMVLKYPRKPEEQKAIYDLYMRDRAYINNWDLVDLSAHHIVGPYLEHRDRSILRTLAKSKVLWDRRIAILSCFYFIKNRDFVLAFELADVLISDTHDLMHKAVGWMLREIGNKDPQAERAFLAERYKKMPRTMLRYAIEKFPEKERKGYLAGLQ